MKVHNAEMGSHDNLHSSVNPHERPQSTTSGTVVVAIPVEQYNEPKPSC